jgi:organic hydroperoxide reductase OsmC/OhrA
VSKSPSHSYLATIRWVRGPAPFIDAKYSRAHEWHFDGGIIVPASSSPQVVPLPYSLQAAVDPEEAFVASLSSCHMLFALSFAAKAGFVVDEYTDSAEGLLTRDSAGKLSMTQVTLRPRMVFSGPKAPTAAQHDALHHEAHEECFIASSVRSEIICQPEMVVRSPKPPFPAPKLSR